MSDQDRVHEPSPIRLLKAREEGLVARSAELSRGLIICIVLGGLLLGSNGVEKFFARQIKTSIANSGNTLHDPAKLVDSIFSSFFPLFFFFGFLLLLAISIWHIQSPLKLRMEKIVPNSNRVAPSNLISRLLSANHWIRIFWQVFGFLFAVTLTIAFTYSNSRVLAIIASYDFEHSLQVAADILRHGMLATGIFILLFGIGDYVRERIRIHSRLRMSDDELREEAKNNEMNPELRRRLYG